MTYKTWTVGELTKTLNNMAKLMPLKENTPVFSGDFEGNCTHILHELQIDEENKALFLGYEMHEDMGAQAMHLDDLMKSDSIVINIEVNREKDLNGKDNIYELYIGQDNVSGCSYEVHNTSDILEYIDHYLRNCAFEV